MQDDIRKKVFLDVFVSKSTLLPVVLGGTTTLLSLATDQYLLALGGFAAIVAGVGIFATRFIFNLESVTENAFNYLQEKKKAEFEEKLNKLEEELSNNKDREQLRVLRASYAHHKEQTTKGDVVTSDALEERLEKLFQGCIEQLKYANELYNTAQTLTKDAKKGVIERREKVLTEIKDSIQCFNNIIDEITGINTDKSAKSLSDLRDEAKSSFDVVKRTEARLSELDGPQRSEVDIEEFRKYATENKQEK
jgi:flagellar motility protein MotE (MotC chaperone)